ncbi:2-succinyl-5-enolpyruvyl-6-hydroxy-3-cyclohexene-1-carboxylic-acid synthase [Ichthyobacterium seriolicida]|uniref:2-succinyl-5-enolpyruvyl-6-hydroxy-3-cyclohexene-1-carboxylate synthase n=1 Tax=Ichthyobacterium seriolicida TaxID=242600 RepID=A0A1J1E8Z8_9FLAO|nr:2-succinyl-5-enolpyruvyl-6-hydroxy-3-cyclohexene-1-carboxylic-acid synthase [Ichthyobacterium seriolicida]BAV94395.1 2-succinyl-5-enolpyruvyl-6-hydroxy-3-cyclohexene-1-carboxylic-acid synthase [Ichthyobacterium seriolicida]
MTKNSIVHSSIEIVQGISHVLEKKKIDQIVISPGSRNAPLIIEFSKNSFFQTFSVVDERCAAFFALGMAQKSNIPSVLVCTSGSAILNYYPAIAESFYQKTPLIVISADRPEILIDRGHGQTIRQKNVFYNHIAKSIHIPEVYSQEHYLMIDEIVNIAIEKEQPVHINLPFDEPLYKTTSKLCINPQSSNYKKKERVLDLKDLNQMREQWERAASKIILIGQLTSKNPELEREIDRISQDPSVIIFTETTSNIYGNNLFPSIDKIINTVNIETLNNLRPDILLTLGGAVISKKIKAFFIKNKPGEHWHIGHESTDTYFCLSKFIDTKAELFFKNFRPKKNNNSNYFDFWNTIKIQRNLRHDKYLKKSVFSDLKALSCVLEAIPDNTCLHVGNSSIIRYVQLFNIKRSLSVFCNRGTSGIEGSTSTAIGAACVSKEDVSLISGDISFFYDSNALWNNYVPCSFRLIVINNGGGGIFRILDESKSLDSLELFFETKHNLTAKHLARMYNWNYLKAENTPELQRQLSNFYQKSDSPCILEVFTPRLENAEVLKDYFDFLKYDKLS